MVGLEVAPVVAHVYLQLHVESGSFTEYWLQARVVGIAARVLSSLSLLNIAEGLTLDSPFVLLVAAAAFIVLCAEMAKVYAISASSRDDFVPSRKAELAAAVANVLAGGTFLALRLTAVAHYNRPFAVIAFADLVSFFTGLKSLRSRVPHHWRAGSAARRRVVLYVTALPIAFASAVLALAFFLASNYAFFGLFSALLYLVGIPAVDDLTNSFGGRTLVFLDRSVPFV